VSAEDLAAVLDQAEVLDARPLGAAARPERPVRDDVERIGVEDDALACTIGVNR
jgi:hypothetical protein